MPTSTMQEDNLGKDYCWSMNVRNPPGAGLRHGSQVVHCRQEARQGKCICAAVAEHLLEGPFRAAKGTPETNYIAMGQWSNVVESNAAIRAWAE